MGCPVADHPLIGKYVFVLCRFYRHYGNGQRLEPPEHGLKTRGTVVSMRRKDVNERGAGGSSYRSNRLYLTIWRDDGTFTEVRAESGLDATITVTEVEKVVEEEADDAAPPV